MWKDSRKYPVMIEVIEHPGPENTSIVLGVHRVSLDASKRIGSGTYGEVFEGTLISQAQQKVAVKVFRHVDKDAFTVLMRILSGISVWWNLAHENVAKLLGITANFDHTISIVSSFIPRRDAFYYVQNPNVDPRPLILGIANGLHYLHTYGQSPIIHGGIKGVDILGFELYV
ncbi:hypothetical protein SCLCIDRAFT_1212559 [Scleroderma citrinum Foug A]|uniref:Protein kinase domain-containing protein n=1 Tax=Scleroderma citrinum Foug A TaxID=1036808 RepID=A0A0C2ZV63_9AGAM|nr:hypothetical protein SCLCIDRAFT_1212559 [Scleroderma citrinum Foug A]